MNYISNEVFNAGLKKVLNQIEKQKSNSVEFRKLIETETLKLLKKHLGEENFIGDIYQGGGLKKEQILNYLEDIFGKKNFTQGKYQGGKEIILATINEVFGSQNIVGGKFQGGWNEKQDTANIYKVFKTENFKDGEYIGGWNQEQDRQNLQNSLTNGEAKTITSQIIEDKFGGSEKFSDGNYKIKEEVIKSVVEELKAEGLILKEIHNIFGPEDFYPTEPGENVPKGREGFRKNAKELALQQAEEQAQIKAIEAWREFFEDHGIVDSSDKLFWSNKYGSNVKAADSIYKDALLKGEEVVGGDFTKLEENRINKAPTPEKIQEVLKDIPLVRRKKAWENFFTNHDTLGNIKEEWKENWRKSSLSIEVAKLIYNNGWYNSPNGLINDNKIIENYTTEILVMGKKYPQTTTGLETLKHLAEEVDKVHEFLAKRIETETDLTKFPTDEEIKQAYNEKKVPDTKSWGEVSKIRNNQIKSLFKQYFQEKTPVTNLKDNDIELWRTSPTGLSMTGKDQRQVFDNGWTNPKEIAEGKTNYQGISGIEVLKVNKKDIDQEIAKVEALVKKINSYKFLRDLDKEQTSIDQQFQILKTELLPPTKPQEVQEAIKTQKNNLWYSLTDPQDGGLEEATLKKLATNLQNTWNVPNYEPMTVKRLNDFIAADKDVQSLGLFKEDAKWEDLNTPNAQLYGTNEKGQPHSWLSKQGGYELPKDKTDAEEKLDIAQRGAYLLKFFYDKCKDGKGYPFNPDKLTDKDIHFCQIGTKTGKIWKKKMMGGEWVEAQIPTIGGDKGNSGHLAIGTGIGKTTKLINCLIRGGERHIILACPTTGLADSAFKHHTGWLQDWGCVYHGGAKGETEMAYCVKGKYIKATQEDIDQGRAESEMRSIYKSHGSYPVTKNDLVYWFNANTNQKEGKETGKKGLSIMYFGNLFGFADRNLFVESGGINSWSDESEKQKVKEKLIPKDDTIIVFDEAHFNDAGYQALQFEMTKAGYNCLRMSATFAGSEFSTTSSYPMKRVFSGKLDPNMPAGIMVYQNAEQVEKLETLRGVPIGSVKWQDENNFPIPIEVNLEERIQTGTTWIFGKNLELNDEQRRALGNNVSYMVYTPEFDPICEDMSFGRPKGSADNVDCSKEMGYTPGIDSVICLGTTETTNLGKYFTYSDPTLGFTMISSLVQQQGRVGRIKPGLAITLTKECGEIDLSDNVSAAMVKAAFDSDIKQINDKEYKQIYDIDILRGAIAYPDLKTFGKAPEEILMGLKISKDQQSKKEKIAKLVWRQDNEEDKKEAMAKPWYAFMAKDINPSEKLWNHYLGKSEAITMGEDQAKNLLKEMISNFITQDKNYPQGLNLKNQAKFIASVFGTKLDSGDKDTVIKETRTVLNGLVEAKVNELGSKDYEETNKRSKNPSTIKKLSGLYKLTEAQIDYQKMKNNEGELVWTLLMKA